MKVTKENYKEFIPEKEQSLLESLFKDLEDLNKYTEMKLFIDWQDYHDEYSCERTDPCPDFYGYYTLRFEEFPYNVIGIQMTISELDNSICLLYCYNFVQNNKDFFKKNLEYENISTGD